MPPIQLNEKTGKDVNRLMNFPTAPCKHLVVGRHCGHVTENACVMNGLYQTEPRRVRGQGACCDWTFGMVAESRTALG